MKKILFLSFTFGFIGFACTTNQVPTTVPALPLVVPSDYCAAAESNLKTLGCISTTAPYTLKGKSFTLFCQETQNNGIDLGSQCLSSITNCAKMDSCAGTTKGNK